MFSQMGEVYTFSRGSHLASKRGELCNISYSSFIGKAVRYAKAVGPVDIMVLDNRKATIPGLLIRKLYHPKSVVQDCRELYLLKEVHSFASMAGSVFEKAMVKRADIVICANKERAEIMQKEYALPVEPLVYENLRQLEYESDADLEAAKKKFASFLREDEVRLISTSGCHLSRTNDVLVRNLKNVTKKCRLFIAGDSPVEDENEIQRLAAEDHVNEVTFLGRVNQTELKYLISQCQIGIVNYGQYDTNNKYCASGKLYEFLYEGIPVVTTTNPPLKNFCDKYHVGIADDLYFDAINTILSNYLVYNNNVLSFIQYNTVEKNDLQLISVLKTLLRQNN